MLKFVNKKGLKVMEMKDNGDLMNLSEELKATGLEEAVQEVVQEEENKKDIQE